MASPRIVRDIPGWPTVFELDIHETIDLPTPGSPTRLTLLSVEEHTEPDFWIQDNPAHATTAIASVYIELDGTKHTLLLRPYQMPVTINGLRLYVEATKAWATRPQSHPIPDVQRAVRLAATPAGGPWGPTTLRFPVADFRWRSSSYQNTWSSLVPFNAHYYHRGEDFGSIPNLRPVLAMFDGHVRQSPLPAGDGQSNGLTIESPDGMSVRFAHMDIESVDPALIPGTHIRAGQPFAKTGMTWAGRKSQTNDPHLHIQFNFGQTFISPYPSIVESYFRDYPDTLLAVAGGYAFGVVGQPIELDATRSFARPGNAIAGHRWTVPGGRHADTAITTTVFDRPGYYSIPLDVFAANGTTDRDFLQIRIYDPAAADPRDIAFGWIYAHPTRNVRPGASVTLWNRLTKTRNTHVDWGDGSVGAIDREATHAYARSGLYTISVAGHGPREEPVIACMRIIID